VLGAWERLVAVGSSLWALPRWLGTAATCGAWSPSRSHSRCPGSLEAPVPSSLASVGWGAMGGGGHRGASGVGAVSS
jgi:hypothetical protein